MFAPIPQNATPSPVGQLGAATSPTGPPLAGPPKHGAPSPFRRTTPYGRRTTPTMAGAAASAAAPPKQPLISDPFAFNRLQQPGPSPPVLAQPVPFNPTGSAPPLVSQPGPTQFFNPTQPFNQPAVPVSAQPPSSLITNPPAQQQQHQQQQQQQQQQQLNVFNPMQHAPAAAPVQFMPPSLPPTSVPLPSWAVPASSAGADPYFQPQQGLRPSGAEAMPVSSASSLEHGHLYQQGPVSHGYQHAPAPPQHHPQVTHHNDSHFSLQHGQHSQVHSTAVLQPGGPRDSYMGPSPVPPPHQGHPPYGHMQGTVPSATMDPSGHPELGAGSVQRVAPAQGLPGYGQPAHDGAVNYYNPGLPQSHQAPYRPGSGEYDQELYPAERLPQNSSTSAEVPTSSGAPTYESYNPGPHAHEYAPQGDVYTASPPQQQHGVPQLPPHLDNTLAEPSSNAETYPGNAAASQYSFDASLQQQGFHTDVQGRVGYNSGPAHEGDHNAHMSGCADALKSPQTDVDCSTVSMFFRDDDVENFENVSSHQATMAPTSIAQLQPSGWSQADSAAQHGVPEGANVNSSPASFSNPSLENPDVSLEGSVGGIVAPLNAASTIQGSGHWDYTQNQEVPPRDPFKQENVGQPTNSPNHPFGAVHPDGTLRDRPPQLPDNAELLPNVETPDSVARPGRPASATSSTLSGVSMSSAGGHAKKPVYPKVSNTFIQQENPAGPHPQTLSGLGDFYHQGPATAPVNVQLSADATAAQAWPGSPSPPRPTGHFQLSRNSSFEPFRSPQHSVVDPADGAAAPEKVGSWDETSLNFDEELNKEHFGARGARHRALQRTAHANMELLPDNQEIPSAVASPANPGKPPVGVHSTPSERRPSRPLSRSSALRQMTESPMTTLWAQDGVPGLDETVILAPAAPALQPPRKPAAGGDVIQPPEEEMGTRHGGAIHGYTGSAVENMEIPPASKMHGPAVIGPAIAPVICPVAPLDIGLVPPIILPQPQLVPPTAADLSRRGSNQTSENGIVSVTRTQPESLMHHSALSQNLLLTFVPSDSLTLPTVPAISAAPVPTTQGFVGGQLFAEGARCATSPAISQQPQMMSSWQEESLNAQAAQHRERPPSNYGNPSLVGMTAIDPPATKNALLSFPTQGEQHNPSIYQQIEKPKSGDQALDLTVRQAAFAQEGAMRTQEGGPIQLQPTSTVPPCPPPVSSHLQSQPSAWQQVPGSSVTQQQPQQQPQQQQQQQQQQQPPPRAQQPVVQIPQEILSGKSQSMEQLSEPTPSHQVPPSSQLPPPQHADSSAASTHVTLANPPIADSKAALQQQQPVVTSSYHSLPERAASVEVTATTPYPPDQPVRTQTEQQQDSSVAYPPNDSQPPVSSSHYPTGAPPQPSSSQHSTAEHQQAGQYAGSQTGGRYPGDEAARYAAAAAAGTYPGYPPLPAGTAGYGQPPYPYGTDPWAHHYYQYYQQADPRAAQAYYEQNGRSASYEQPLSRQGSYQGGYDAYGRYRPPEPERPSSRASHYSERGPYDRPDGYYAADNYYGARAYGYPPSQPDQPRADGYSYDQDMQLRHPGYYQDVYYGRRENYMENWPSDPRLPQAADDDPYRRASEAYAEDFDRRSVHSERSTHSVHSVRSERSHRSAFSTHSQQARSAVYRAPAQEVHAYQSQTPTPASESYLYEQYPSAGYDASQGYGYQYDYTTQSWQSGEQVAPAPVRPMTPEKFVAPHTIARFGPGGQLIKVLPNMPADGQPALVEIHNVEVMMQESEEQTELRCFPGPLVKDETHKVDVITFAQNKAMECLRNDKLIDKKSAALLWELLVLICRQNGTVVGTDIAELLLRGHRAGWHPGRAPNDEANLIDLSGELGALSGLDDDAGAAAPQPALLLGAPEDGPVGQASLLGEGRLSSEEAVAQATDRFRQLLLFGRKKDALESAMKNDLWGHALLLASKMDGRTHANVMTRFANSLPMNDPLQTCYQQQSGRMPAAATSCCDERWGDWRPHLAMILSNITSNPDLDRRTITTMGDTLASKGLVDAAHFCYLMAQVSFDMYNKRSAKLVLLGANHSLPLAEFMSNESIQRTEVYEYAQSLGSNGTSATLSNFQPFKLLYASRLAENGLVAQAMQYCEVIGNTVLEHPSLYTHAFLVQLVSLSAQLRPFDPQLKERPEEEQFVDPEWLTQLRFLEQQMKEGLIQPCSGRDTPHGFDSSETSSIVTPSSSEQQLNVPPTQPQQPPLAAHQAPPPGMQAPPPGMQAPPPGMQAPPPGFQVPPTTYLGEGPPAGGFQTQQALVHQMPPAMHQAHAGSEGVQFMQPGIPHGVDAQAASQHPGQQQSFAPDGGSPGFSPTHQQAGYGPGYPPTSMQPHMQGVGYVGQATSYGAAGMAMHSGEPQSVGYGMQTLQAPAQHAQQMSFQQGDPSLATVQENGAGGPTNQQRDHFDDGVRMERRRSSRLSDTSSYRERRRSSRLSETSSYRATGRRSRTLSESSVHSIGVDSNPMAPDAKLLSNKTEKKDKEKPADKTKGSKGGWFSWLLPKKNEAHLPEDKNKSIVWDDKRKKWVNLEEPEDESKPPPPPPISALQGAQLPGAGAAPGSMGPLQGQQGPGGLSAPSAPQGGVNMFSRRAVGARGRGRYVDVMNPGGAAAPPQTTAPPPEMFAPLAPMANLSSNFFVPSGPVPVEQQHQQEHQQEQQHHQQQQQQQQQQQHQQEQQHHHQQQHQQQQQQQQPQEMPPAGAADGPALPVGTHTDAPGPHLQANAPEPQGPAAGFVPFFNPTQFTQPTGMPAGGQRGGRLGARKYPAMK
ncbi:protein transport protein Sec16A-like isoform X3 [Lampetra planeri]